MIDALCSSAKETTNPIKILSQIINLDYFSSVYNDITTDLLFENADHSTVKDNLYNVYVEVFITHNI